MCVCAMERVESTLRLGSHRVSAGERQVIVGPGSSSGLCLGSSEDATFEQVTMVAKKAWGLLLQTFGILPGCGRIAGA